MIAENPRHCDCQECRDNCYCDNCIHNCRCCSCCMQISVGPNHLMGHDHCAQVITFGVPGNLTERFGLHLSFGMRPLLSDVNFNLLRISIVRCLENNTAYTTFSFQYEFIHNNRHFHYLDNSGNYVEIIVGRAR